MMVKISARFLNSVTGLSDSLEGIQARLYDQDPVSDDFLCETVLDASGEAHWLFDLSGARSPDSPGESKPDLYVELLQKGKVLFQSPVIRNVQFVSVDEVSGENHLKTQELGTFHVNLS